MGKPKSDWYFREIIDAHGQAKTLPCLTSSKRRCPQCDSNKWKGMGAVPITLEELNNHLLVQYRCLKCGVEFLVQETRGSRYVDNSDRCCFCQSDALDRVSKPGADVELWVCKRCHGYMAVRPQGCFDSAAVAPRNPPLC